MIYKPLQSPRSRGTHQVSLARASPYLVETDSDMTRSYCTVSTAPRNRENIRERLEKKSFAAVPTKVFEADGLFERQGEEGAK